HRDDVCVRFCAPPRQPHVLMDNELQLTLQRSLDRRDIHFAVSLCCMTVADLEQGALNMNGYEERGACNKLLVIQVAALLKRPTSFGGATPMLPKKGRNGTSIPLAKCPIIFSRSRRMIWYFLSKISSDMNPLTPIAL